MKILWFSLRDKTPFQYPIHTAFFLLFSVNAVDYVYTIDHFRVNSTNSIITLMAIALLFKSFTIHQIHCKHIIVVVGAEIIIHPQIDCKIEDSFRIICFPLWIIQYMQLLKYPGKIRDCSIGLLFRFIDKLLIAVSQITLPHCGFLCFSDVKLSESQQNTNENNTNGFCCTHIETQVRSLPSK